MSHCVEHLSTVLSNIITSVPRPCLARLTVASPLSPRRSTSELSSFTLLTSMSGFVRVFVVRRNKRQPSTPDNARPSTYTTHFQTNCRLSSCWFELFYHEANRYLWALSNEARA